ncbi:MAG TPA: RsmE family RNA methyltransferase [Thermoanaerobaculia bacterium]|nr:RsmE family RNA methyltransferase [Thermoanaerobaculia bacterium]
MHHRILIDAIQSTVTVSGDEFHHSIRVVRLREGEEVEVFDRAGKMAKAVVATIAKDHAVLNVGDEIASRESPLQLTLAMSIIQLEKFELVLQKATELGVHAIVPLITDRIELRAERYAGKADRWQRIVFEAVKQSGRGLVPAIESPQKFDDVITREGTKIVFDADLSPSPAQPHNRATAFIGPEGGFSPRELDLAEQQQAIFQRLGPRRLRAETAAIVALTIVAARFGDL